jgi:hypothetical protein
VDECLVEVEEDGLEVWVLPVEFDFLFGLRDLDGPAHAEHFHALVEVLPVKVHEVGGFVLAQAAFETGDIVHLLRVSD